MGLLLSLAFADTIATRFPPPAGYRPATYTGDSFSAWLRSRELKPGNPPVYLYDGRKKGYQGAHAAVLTIDVGKKDLQQCADAVIRLRAEYLFERKRFDQIHFKYTDGKVARFSDTPDRTPAAFRAYLERVFMFAGSYSLAKEMKSVKNRRDLKAGDVFIQGGFPGHAVIVMDVAEKGEEKLFLLAQSYMPAQDVHVLKNPNDETLSPWYRLGGDDLVTPEWNFKWTDLKSF